VSRVIDQPWSPPIGGTASGSAFSAQHVRAIARGGCSRATPLSSAYRGHHTCTISITSPFPLLMVAVTFPFLRGLRGHCVTPLVCAEARFLLCFVGLGISYFPYIIPPSNAIWQAAAPASSQGFLPIGTVIMIPIILPYMACSYWTFGDRVEPDAHHH
jgi:cytochrome bd-type quinol oxidase subunit 2